MRLMVGGDASVEKSGQSGGGFQTIEEACE